MDNKIVRPKMDYLVIGLFVFLSSIDLGLWPGYDFRTSQWHWTFMQGSQNLFTFLTVVWGAVAIDYFMRQRTPKVGGQRQK
jgi:hypothetical protein